MFFVVGADFRGFHVRFRDVARGGIRIIRSRGKEWVKSHLTGRGTSANAIQELQHERANSLRRELRSRGDSEPE